MKSVCPDIKLSLFTLSDVLSMCLCLFLLSNFKVFKQYTFPISQLHILQTVTFVTSELYGCIDTVDEGKSILSIVFNIKQFIFPLGLYFLMTKVKTVHPDSDKVQLLVQLLNYPYSQL